MIKSKDIITAINRISEVEIPATIRSSTPDDIIRYLKLYLVNIEIKPTNERIRKILLDLIADASSRNIKISLNKALEIVK
jgi:hypothetical protein